MGLVGRGAQTKVIIRKGRTFGVRMAEFETFTFRADVTISHYDMGFTDEALAALSDTEHEDMLASMVDLIEITLVELLRRDIEEAANLTETRKDYIKSIFLDEPQTPDSPKPSATPASKPKVRKINGRS